MALKLYLLEIASCFVESQQEQFVVIPIRDVEKLRQHSAPKLVDRQRPGIAHCR